MKKLFQVILALVSFVAIAMQFYVTLQGTAFSKAMIIGNFFSYFTILTNIIVCLSYIDYLLKVSY